MAKSIQTLKSYFLDGKKPTENEFADLIEAFVHRNDDLKTILGNFAELAEAQAGVVNDKYMTPFLAKAAIVALTRLANIPALKTELEGLFLGKGDKAADSDMLDGKEAADFYQKNLTYGNNSHLLKGDESYVAESLFIKKGQDSMAGRRFVRSDGARLLEGHGGGINVDKVDGMDASDFLWRVSLSDSPTNAARQ